MEQRAGDDVNSRFFVCLIKEFFVRERRVLGRIFL